jgi:prefoldin subunit 5
MDSDSEKIKKIIREVIKEELEGIKSDMKKLEYIENKINNIEKRLDNIEASVSELDHKINDTRRFVDTFVKSGGSEEESWEFDPIPSGISGPTFDPTGRYYLGL